jgi:hypothetical protein
VVKVRSSKKLKGENVKRRESQKDEKLKGGKRGEVKRRESQMG